MGSYDLKKPEEVKEYLKNLHIEYKFGCYSEKNPEVCHLLGDFTESIKKDFKKATLLFKMNCDERNYPRSCRKYGDYSLIGKGCETDMRVAYKYLTKACELGDSKACYHGGVLAISTEECDDKGRAAQITTGMKMLKKACEESFEPSCFHLSGIYLTGVEEHVDKNLKEAYKLSLKCCEMGNPYACANLSQMHARGDGVQKNPELADTFKQRAKMLHDELRKFKQPVTFQSGIDP